MNLQSLPTTVLLDKAEEVKGFAKKYHGSVDSSVAPKMRLAEIDAELLSRMPEGKFVTMLDEDGKPVGFEPECYTRLAEAQVELLDAEDQLDRIRFGGI